MSEPSLIPYSETLAKRVAWILGPQSAAAKALADLKRRRDSGEEVALYRCGGLVVVCPLSDPLGRPA